MTVYVEAELLSAYRSTYQGMVERDTDLLDDLLADDYTLTHMTGYTQSKTEWLAQIASGERPRNQNRADA
nr:DUF4440 domain-containing protein [Rhodococcus sp. (in: high G+C Gram-positive bacteria)]